MTFHSQPPWRITLAPEAATLTAVRIVNGKPITYITDSAQGRPPIEHALIEARTLGHLGTPEGKHCGCPETISPWPEVDEHHGVLDILNAQDELVQDFPLASEEAFAWFENRLGLTPTPTN